MHGTMNIKYMIVSCWINIRMGNVSDKTKTRVLCSLHLFPKSCRLWDNVVKYRTARRATDDSIILHTRFACRVTKATNTHSEYIIRNYCFSPGNSGYANARQYYVLRTLPVLCLQYGAARKLTYSFIFMPFMNIFMYRLNVRAVCVWHYWWHQYLVFLFHF